MPNIKYVETCPVDDLLLDPGETDARLVGVSLGSQGLVAAAATLEEVVRERGWTSAPGALVRAVALEAVSGVSFDPITESGAVVGRDRPGWAAAVANCDDCEVRAWFYVGPDASGSTPVTYVEPPGLSAVEAAVARVYLLGGVGGRA